MPKTQRDRAIAAVRSLANEPRPTGVKKLKGYDETYRIRFGDYRVIYKVQDKELTANIDQVRHKSVKVKSSTNLNNLNNKWQHTHLTYGKRY